MANTERFTNCTNCGARLDTSRAQGATLCEPCDRVSQERRQLTLAVQTPTVSQLVYLFADEFISNGMGGHQPGYYSDEKIIPSTTGDERSVMNAVIGMLFGAVLILISPGDGKALGVALVLGLSARLAILISARKPKASVDNAADKAWLGLDRMGRDQLPAALLFATTFWRLREQGMLAVELQPGLDTDGITIAGTGRHYVGRGDFEGQIMATVSPGMRRALSWVVIRWFPEQQPDPWATVLRAVALDVRLARLAPDTATRAAFDDLLMRWRHFQASEPAVYDALLRECERGLAARKPVSTGNSGGGSWGGGDWFDNDDGDGDWDFD